MLWGFAPLCPALLQLTPQAVGFDQHVLGISKLLLPARGEADPNRLKAIWRLGPLFYTARQIRRLNSTRLGAHIMADKPTGARGDAIRSTCYSASVAIQRGKGPILPIVLLIDSIVSMLRIYNTEELRDLTTGLGCYHWSAGTVQGKPIPFPVLYLVGVPIERGPE